MKKYQRTGLHGQAAQQVAKRRHYQENRRAVIDRAAAWKRANPARAKKNQKKADEKWRREKRDRYEARKRIDSTWMYQLAQHGLFIVTTGDLRKLQTKFQSPTGRIQSDDDLSAEELIARYKKRTRNQEGVTT